MAPASAISSILLAVDHVGIAVPDMDAGLAFHTEVLGLELRSRERNDDQGVEEAMLAPPGAPAGTTSIQLLAPLGEASPLARFLDRSGPGLQQLAYRVKDLGLATTLLQGRGIRLIYDSGRRGTNGTLINFVHPKDSGGVLIELVEMPLEPGRGE